MNYKIDQGRRLVLTRGWGVLSSRELFDVTSQILLDPRFDPTYRSLGDLRDVTEVTVDTLETAYTAATPLFAAVRLLLRDWREIRHGEFRLSTSFLVATCSEVEAPCSPARRGWAGDGRNDALTAAYL